MPKVSPAQENFNAGELSPLLYGRRSLEKYKNAMKTCKNHILRLQGAASTKPGTYYAATVKDSSKATRVVRFEYSVTQAYIIEFGDQYLRFFKDHAQITATGQNITGITKANPAVVTYSGADTYANGDKIVITGVLGMTEVNNREFTVANVDTGANTFELSGVNSSAYTTYSSAGTVSEIYSITTPYLEADLFELKFTQSADTLYIFHPDYAPRKLTRSGHTSWTLSTISFQDGPYLPTNAETTTLTLSGTTGSVTVTASAVTGINDDTGFQTTDVGRLIRWKDPANNWTWLTITARASTTSITATISGPDASAGTATTNWRLGVWSDTTGYPGTGTFYEDRLMAAGCTSYPQRIDGSKSGDYENMAPTAAAGTVADDNAVAFTLNSSDVNVIRWLADDEKGLLAGTVRGEWLIRPSAQSEALTPTNISAKQSTRHGSANVQPVKAGRSTLFVQRQKRKLRELMYMFEVDGFRAPDASLLSAHITAGGITQLAYQEEPINIVWAVRGDGALLGLTYDRDQEVAGWHRHILGGAFGSGDSVVESVAVIPAPDGLREELWLVVKRTINGSTVRTIEYMAKMFEDDVDDQVDAFCVDCGLTYDSSPTTTITGLYHLEGQEVTILADGATHPNKTVSAGKITLDIASSVVHVGLGYECDAELLPFEAGSADGTAQGKKRKAHRVVFNVQNAGSFKVGSELTAAKLQTVTFRKSTDPTAAATPLYSGITEVVWNGGYDPEESICWRQDLPLPLTVRAVMPQMITQDRG